MTSLDYLLILEGLILLIAGVFGCIAEIFGKDNPNDELKRIMHRFWREMIFPTAPSPMVSAAIGYEDQDGGSTTEEFAKSSSK